MRPDPQPADLVTFTKEILNGRLHFLYSVRIRQRTLKNTKNQLNITAKRFILIIRPGQTARPMLIGCAGEHKKLLRKAQFFSERIFCLAKKEKTIRSTNFQSNR